MNTKTQIVKDIIKGLNIKSILAEELEKIEKIADVLIKNKYVKSCVINPDGYYLQCPYCGSDVTCFYVRVEKSKNIDEINRLNRLLEAKQNELEALMADYEEICDEHSTLITLVEEFKQLNKTAMKVFD